MFKEILSQSILLPQKFLVCNFFVRIFWQLFLLQNDKQASNSASLRLIPLLCWIFQYIFVRSYSRFANFEAKRAQNGFSKCLNGKLKKGALEVKFASVSESEQVVNSRMYSITIPDIHCFFSSVNHEFLGVFNNKTV